MDFVILFICPAILLAIIMLICKKYKFTIIPEDLQQRKNPEKFKFPTISRKKQGKWTAEY